MRRFAYSHNPVRLLVVSLALCSCADGPDPVEVPFEPAYAAAVVNGVLTGSMRITPVSGSLVRVDVSAEGIITHLGRVTATWALPQVVLDPASGRAFPLVQVWTGSIVAANGDRIDGEYTLRGTSVAVTASGDFAIDADILIRNGTGRFAGYAGSGLSHVRGNALSGRLSVTVTGDFQPAR